MPFSTEYANRILNCAFGKTDMNKPTYVYLGLSTNDPVADGGSFAELTGGGYTRVMIVSNQTGGEDKMASAADRLIQSNKQINWVKATEQWNPAIGFGLFTASTGGTPYFYGKLKESITVPAGAIALFDPGDLKVGISSVDEEIA